MTMVKKDGRRYEVELDWYYISKETVGRIAVWFLAAVAVVVVLVYFVVGRSGSVARRASTEISAAEQAVAKVRLLPDSARVKEELEAAAGKVVEAREHYKASRFQEALNAAVEARSVAQRLIGGGGSSRHDAAIMEFGGKVEVQRANRATWEAVRVGMRLYDGDFLKTGANGLAEVMSIDGTYYRIKPETLFEVQRTSSIPGASPGEAQRKSEIKFIVGTVDINTGEGVRSVVRTDGATADIGSRSTVGVEADSKATGVSAYRGSVTLSTSGGAQVTLRDRERAVASGAGIGVKTRLPDAPQPLGPDDAAVFDLRSKGPIRIRWSAVKDASRYRIQIAASRLFIPDSIVAADDRTVPEIEIAADTAGAYFWRVASLGRGGLQSEWSAVRRFKVVAPSERGGNRDTTPPDLLVQRPQVNGTLVIVTGRTEPGSSVTVNGESAETDPAGSFKKVISMTREGINTVVVRATDGAGNETVRRENVVIEIY